MSPAVLAELGALALGGVLVAGGAFGLRVGEAVGGVVYGVACASGLALLSAIAPSEWVLGLALVPLTALNGVVFGRVVRRRLPGWRGWTATVLLLFVGAALLLSQTPRPLTRAAIVGDDAPVRTITPGASRPVRG